LEYRKTTEFCILILHLATLLKVFIRDVEGFGTVVSVDLLLSFLLYSTSICVCFYANTMLFDYYSFVVYFEVR
jgi:hypothetical protein